MAEKNRGAELPQRVPGAVRAGPVSPIALALPEELRQRMHAAVIAEVTEAAADEQERASGDRTAPAAAGPGPAVWPEPEKPRRRPGARLIALVLTLIVIGSLAAVAAAVGPPRREPSARRLPPGSPGRSARMSPCHVTR